MSSQDGKFTAEFACLKNILEFLLRENPFELSFFYRRSAYGSRCMKIAYGTYRAKELSTGGPLGKSSLESRPTYDFEGKIVYYIFWIEKSGVLKVFCVKNNF